MTTAGRIRSVPRPEERQRPPGFAWPHYKLPVAFVNVCEGDDKPARGLEDRDGLEDEGPKNPSYQNSREAATVVRAVLGLLRAGTPSEAIGVITPYSAQARLIREALTAAQEDAEKPGTTGVKRRTGRRRRDEHDGTDGADGRTDDTIVLKFQVRHWDQYSNIK